MTVAEQIIQKVNNIVYPSYLVGGSVRDIILGVEPKDYDFTTPLSPDTVESLIRKAGRKPYLIGKKFGTIGFKVHVTNDTDQTSSYIYVEITTYRKESYKLGSRKPEVVFVDNLKDDLSRRDLTINAIAIKDGEYYDPFGGRIDILQKKIKAVGEATERFTEDPLRILRVARFACRLDFSIDPNLIGKARKMAHKISNISRERWVLEIDKILESKKAYKGITYLQNLGVLQYIIPELSQVLNDYVEEFLFEELDEIVTADEGWTVICRCIAYNFVKENQTEKQLYNKIFPNYKSVGNLIVDGIGSRLKFSNQRIKYIKNNL